jgi:hypothetical protein
VAVADQELALVALMEQAEETQLLELHYYLQMAVLVLLITTLLAVMVELQVFQPQQQE